MSEAILAVEREHALPLEAGGKARGLQLIARAGLPFPAAWVVLPGASGASIGALAERLRAASPGLFAVRSSARDEDDERHSFAGIHESRIGIPAAELPGAIAEVAASAVSERARAYRNQLGLPPPPGPCAVLVQPLVPSACSGVAFGIGDDSERVVIEAVEGFGEAAVHGDARPERHVLVRAPGGWRTERCEPRLQPVARVWSGDSQAGGRLVTVTLTGGRRHAPVLDGDRAAAIARGVERLEQLAGVALDAEWTWADGTLWFLQARPRTRPLREDLPPKETWTRANVRDVLPEIPSAFARSTIGKSIDRGVRDHLGEYGVRIPAGIPLIAFVHGRPAFNERTLVVGDMLGISRATMQAEFGGVSEADDRVVPMDFGKAIRHPLVLYRALTLPAGAERHAQAFMAHARDLRRELESVRPSEMLAADLFELMRAHLGDLGGRFARTSLRVAAAATHVQYPALYRLRRHPTPRALMATLVAGSDPSVTTRQVDDLLRVAGALRGWSGAKAFLGDMARERATLDAWRERLPAAPWQAVSEWLARYGHRGPYESDLASPRYVDDPRLLARLLLPLVSREGLTAADARDRRREAAESAWREVERLVGAGGRRRTERDVARLKRITALREQVREETVATLLPMRRIGQALGERLVREGRIADPEDLWHLSLDEMSRAFAQPGYDVRSAVARERARIAAWRRVEVPNRFTSEDVPNLGLIVDVHPDVSVHVGNGISPGTAEGHARVLLTPGDGDRLGVGDVLVAPSTDPGWTPLFTRAAAIVVELGGALSHAGIVAREFGIPCVANVHGATRLLRDGDLVRVDGASGRVILVSRAAPRSSTDRSEGGSS